jgi:hypothetical protein
MRNLIVFVLVSILVLLALPPAKADIPPSCKTLIEWATSPIVIGDQMYTFISSNWLTSTRFWYQKGYSQVYDAQIDPLTDRSIYHETRSLVYKVTIIDDPTTPENEAAIDCFTQVAIAPDWSVQMGTATYTVTFDNNSDFSSPLLILSITSPDQVLVAPMPGAPKELYVSVFWDVSEAYAGIGMSNVEYIQGEAPVPTASTTWGNIKALYE